MDLVEIAIIGFWRALYLRPEVSGDIIYSFGSIVPIIDCNANYIAV